MVKKGAVNGIVAISFGNHTVKADITNEATETLGLKEGDKAVAIVKATSVIVGVE